MNSGAENIPPANLKPTNLVVLPELEGWTPSLSIRDILASLKELIATGGPLPDDLLSPGDLEGGMTDEFMSGQQVNLDLFQGTIFPCRVRTSQGLINRYLGITDSWALELEAHKTRWVGWAGRSACWVGALVAGALGQQREGVRYCGRAAVRRASERSSVLVR